MSPALREISDPILFVSAQSRTDTKDNENSSKRVHPGCDQMSGHEVYTFYTTLCQKPSEASRGYDRGRQGDVNFSTFNDSTILGRKSLSNKKSRPVKKKSCLSAGSSQIKKTYSVSEIFTFAQEGKLRELKEALNSSNDFDLNHQDMHGWTILMSAACGGHLDVVDYLLTRGAEVGTRYDRKGRNAIDLAKASHHFEIAEWIQARESNTKASGTDNETEVLSNTIPSSPYHCSTCGIVLKEAQEQDHRHSTLHQFNCQHRPRMQHYAIPQSNKGYKLLVDSGWDPDRGLGCEADGRKYPVKTVLKRDRLGLGAGGSRGEKPRARITHFGPGDPAAVEALQRKRLNKKDSGGTHLSKKKRREEDVFKNRMWEAKLRRYFNSD